MPLEIGPVQSTSYGPAGNTSIGYGFNLKDSTGHRWITLSYRTEVEANDARTAIEKGTTGVINAHIHRE